MPVPICIGCGATVDDARCGHCGIAVSPGGWKIIRQIATGPHSRVFLAEKGGEEAALKELLFALVPDSALLEGFEREARLLAQLKHPAIPRLVESFTEGKGVHTRLYLAQQFVRGKSLLDELDGHRFDEAEVKRLASSLLGVLEYLHGLSPRVIHRDIKPANVMRREDGSLALVDFGAARDLVRGITHGSTLVGTFGYMPPEQMGGTVDLTADLYALGATLLHLLSRKPPDELLKPGMELAFDEAVNVSPPFRGWLQKLVEKDRRARFQTAKAAREALEALDNVVKVAARVKPVRPAGKPAYAVAAAALVGGMGAILWIVGAQSSQDAPKTSEKASASSVATASIARSTPVAPTALPPLTPPRPAPVSPRPTNQAEVQTVAKKVLPPFTPAPFTAAVGAKVPIAANGCDPLSASLEVVQVSATPDALVLSSLLENVNAEQKCANVFVELADSAGGRDSSRATLLSNAKIGTTSRKETKFTLPANHKKVQLRVGPQAKPYAVFDVDLVKGTAVKRQ